MLSHEQDMERTLIRRRLRVLEELDEHGSAQRLDRRPDVADSEAFIRSLTELYERRRHDAANPEA